MNSSAVQRFLSKRDRHGLGKHQIKGKSTTSTTTIISESPLTDYYGLFNTVEKPANAQEEQKIRALRKRLVEAKLASVQDSHTLCSLRSLYASADVDKAFDLLIAMSNSWQGLLTEYQPNVKLLGAQNRKAVTCYLDSLLFAMFSRLDSFEAMLYNTFQDTARNKLGMLIRLWVNLLRSGKLITTDITQLLQESLAECGWKEAAEQRQQDASEAFTFITEKLELPLLTLRMDIYHTGREDATDDHKYVNERLLEVAIPSDPADPEQIIPLEDCLEAYFNNRIEVKRYLERQSTLSATQSSNPGEPISAKCGALHVETVEFSSDAPPGNPPSSTSSNFEIPLRQRAASIIRQRFVPEKSSSGNPPAYEAEEKRPSGRVRSGSIRKEVMMPAWQFFSLIPWYTNNTPKNDAQVAAHFSSKRPILGMCLKRYLFNESGKAIRLSTRIDVPTEIGLPHFISDDSMDEDGPIYGNFKLSLQSVVCHRGKSIDSGHYISLVKGTNAVAEGANGSELNSTQDTNHWMRFDDLASERITLVDINQALKDETPYLLFYQIVPVGYDLGLVTNGESLPLYAPPDIDDSGIEGISVAPFKPRESSDETPHGSRPSVEVAAPEDSLRGRSTARDQRRSSITFSESENHGELVQPFEESTQSSLKHESTIEKGCSQSRSQSQSGERFSISLSRMANKKSRDVITTPESRPDADVKTADGVQAPVAEDEKGKGFLRREGKRAKSKSRSSKVPHMSGKGKTEKPDRECTVM